MVRVIGTFSILAIYLTVAQAWDWAWDLGLREKLCNFRGKTLCKVQFEVSYPQGLQIWTPYKPKLKMFGIELYINPAGKNNVCNLCQNTTDAVDGKFTIHDAGVIVRKGDVLKYVAITDNGDRIERHNPKTFTVKDYINSNSGCDCSASALPTTGLASNPNAEIELLERVVFSLSNGCSGGQASNYLFLQEASLFESDNAVEAVKAYFTKNLTLKPYAEAVTKAESSEGGITFQVTSIVDKLKILELSQADTNLLDYDEMYDSSTIIP